ncbi:YfbK domain-containing protein [Dyadobacter pollutisoli]|uniref:von Willebrand factor type A domain-containing protein n=1 Tax=Dyadobacter pollutisoli TaxID=2910158 RepID=A0A9E8NBI4_9BACT|nr:von Willebrand factor type A domain-containing protein [Dyadobacter pollutisoli]WAC13609.1 von Willebrand factor type A domain-containing protein [Dyadobacter pollutisoli]
MKTKIVILLATFFSAFAMLPDRTITGTISDSNQAPISGVMVTVAGGKAFTLSDSLGKYSIPVPTFSRSLTFSCVGYKTKEVKIAKSSVLNVTMDAIAPGQEEVVEADHENEVLELIVEPNFAKMAASPSTYAACTPMRSQKMNTENYNPINENGFQMVGQQAVTTFSVDVDRASYSNMRRFVNAGQMPPIDAVRIEEMINYFEYDYPQPADGKSVSVTTEITDSPWNRGLKLLHIGLQAKTVSSKNLPASNLVFLIDVSGSMSDENKLPLLKQAFKLLVDQLRAEDKISIVVYAGAAGVILPPTSGADKMKIREALESLEAGGSTAGGEGIEMAYKLAKENFLPKGNNRVILATDGDFNVGISSEGELQRLIEEKRKGGIYLSIMGFGMGNYKDSHIETLADKGNGNYAYIDNIQEARKEFVQEFGGTLFTVAKDVKIQIEFNPAHVQAYRLIGYENRALKNEEFHDDKKDAGDMGSGHTVTAIYEIVPAGMQSSYLAQTDALKYQKNNASEISKTDEMLTIKIRYKNPDSEKSVLFDLPVKYTSKPMSACSENLRFASSVAEFGLLLRNSEFKGKSSYANVIARAKGAFGKDEEGYRSEFVRLVKTTQSLDGSQQTARKD